jgi:tetratricopeptide (TPR) repeat protein
MKYVFLLFLMMLAGCATAPVPETPVARDPVTPEQRVAAILAAAGDDDRELAVQPLRDPQVEDLREKAQRARAARDYAGAAEALNQALLLVPEDPAVLQERAEVALSQGDYARADTLAQRAFQLGSQVGPLCRQHWETVRQVRQHELAVQPSLPARHTPEDAAQHAARAATTRAAIADAESRRDACTVPVIERM